MKLERFKKNTKQKKIVIGAIVGLVLLVGGITLYRTFALFVEKKEYDVLKGRVPELKDILLSITVDGEKVKTIPEKGLYETKVSCTSGEGDFDYVTWSLNVENFESGARCTLAFSTSNLSDSELARRAVAKRRNTYRGKDITSYLNDGSLFTMISNGTFDDIYVGDYVKDSSGRVWLIADLDNYLYTGDTPLIRHHATVIPAIPFSSGQIMNSSDTTVGGYKGSEMYTTILPSYLSTIQGVFGSSHILKYRNLVTNSVNSSMINRFGSATGASDNVEWVNRYLDLMSEVNVFGTTVWSSSGYDTGIDNNQYAIFKLKPELKISYEETQMQYWLKDVVSSRFFAGVFQGRSSFVSASSGGMYVRPRFLIG